MELNTKLKTEELIKSPNIAELLEEEDLNTIGSAVYSDWDIDVSSRADWEERTSSAMKLALQVMETKTFPWPGASNVKFPLVTIAALQYQSRAYPALIPTSEIVKMKVVEEDQEGVQQARASRVAKYMSYQVLEEDECWEENMDKVLISQAIVGCAFKKSYFDAALKHNVSKHVLAKDLYIPYFAESLEKASRITQMLYLSKNDILQKQRTGLFLECDLDRYPQSKTESQLSTTSQEAQGITAPSNDPSAPYEVLEQHRYLDLDGDDYEEPYIVTVHKESKKVLRIVARYNKSGITKNGKGEISFIKADNFYTKFPFIPSPDGGIYDLGFGVLLGPLNESINTILNQLIDGGTLANTAGGFLGRGVKFRSGDNSFKPFEWKRVDSTGDDLRKGVFPLPVREPSPVLFQLLDLLINYGERIGMAVDPLVGENPGQNTPAETSRNMIMEGQRIFSAVFKRTYRALKEEFRKLYKLNSIYLNDEEEFISTTTGETQRVLRQDFYVDSRNLVPAADPNMVTDEQKVQQAQMLKMSAASTPGYNSYQVERRFLEALKVDNIDIVFPDPNGPNALPPPQPDTKVIIETMKIEQKNLEFKTNIQLKIFDLMQELEYLRAEILEKETRAALNLAQAEGIEAGHQVAALQQAVALLKQKQDGLVSTLTLLKDLAGMNKEKKEVVNALSGGVAGMEEATNDGGMV